MRRTRKLLRALALFVVLATIGTQVACSVNNAKKNYVLAEKLWTDGNYVAAVVEFEKAYAKDPRGKVGLQALYRAAMTETFFLSHYGDAVRKLRTYVETAQDQATTWDAQKLIGEVLFAKLEQYDPAIQHYKALIRQNPKSEDVPEFEYRVAKSHFFLSDFDDAIKEFRKLAKERPGTPWGERAAYEIGVTYYTRGEQNPSGPGPGTESYQDAIDSFQEFLNKYPTSKYVPEARFGIASCLEELDQLDAAYHAYDALKQTYPSPKVIEIKLARIRERKTQRSR